MAFCARTLLPASSSGGEMTAIPNFPGETAMIPAADAALGWKAGVVEPFARVVVEAGGRHHRQHVGNILRFHDLLAGDWDSCRHWPACAAITARSFALTLTEHCSV